MDELCCGNSAPPPTNFVLLNQTKNRHFRSASHASQLARILASSSPEITALCKTSALPRATTSTEQPRVRHHPMRRVDSTYSVSSSVSTDSLVFAPDQNDITLPPPPPPLLDARNLTSTNTTHIPSWTDSWLINNNTSNDAVAQKTIIIHVHCCEQQ